MTTTDENHMSVEERRSCLELIALDGLRATAEKIRIGDDHGELDHVDAAVHDPRELLDYVLQATCLELCSVSIQLETEAAPAIAATGSWLGGVLGADSAATDDMGVVLHQRGRELRDHITQKIGWPAQMAASISD